MRLRPPKPGQIAAGVVMALIATVALVLTDPINVGLGLVLAVVILAAIGAVSRWWHLREWRREMRSLLEPMVADRRKHGWTPDELRRLGLGESPAPGDLGALLAHYGTEEQLARPVEGYQPRRCADPSCPGRPYPARTHSLHGCALGFAKDNLIIDGDMLPMADVVPPAVLEHYGAEVGSAVDVRPPPDVVDEYLADELVKRLDNDSPKGGNHADS